jgi:hypothetical protein
MADRVDVPPRAFWATHGLALKANVPAKTGGNPQGGSGVLGHSDERDAESDMTQRPRPQSGARRRALVGRGGESFVEHRDKSRLIFHDFLRRQ